MHVFPYKWKIEDQYPSVGIPHHRSKVFSCFSCGGGSSFGYKLAGYDVIGCNEIDPRMMKCYIENHHPKYPYLEDIRTFKTREDLPSRLYHLDILDGSFPCFLGGTLVMTDKGFKSIRDISIDDKVLTHTNTFQKVTSIMKKEVSKYLNMKIQGCESIGITEDHPFYTRRMIRIGTKETTTRIFSEPVWKKAKDLNIQQRVTSRAVNEQDYIGVAINKNSNLPKWRGVLINNKIKKTLDFSNFNLWYLIGRWFGDGWCRIHENEVGDVREIAHYQSEQKKCLNCNNLTKQHGRYVTQWTSYCSEFCRRQHGRKFKKANRHMVIICCGKHEYHDLKLRIENYTDKYCVTEERSNFKFHLADKELCLYLTQFGHRAKNKHLTNDILDLPIDLLRGFLVGYLDADGHFDKRYKTFCCSSISKSLIYGIQHCVHKVYQTPTTFSIKDTRNKINKIEGRIVNVNKAYGISFSKTERKQQHGFYENGYIWVPFRKATPIDKKTTVYNLSVEKDESYTAYNFICHNCSNFSTSGKRHKHWGKEKIFAEGQAKQVLDTLAFDFIDVAEKLQPKIVIGENVKGLISGRAMDYRTNYISKIHKALDKAGYVSQHFLLDASKMGVPQTRERVFIIALRKDLMQYVPVNNNLVNPLPVLNLKFKQKPILFREVFHDYCDKPLVGKRLQLSEHIKEGDHDLNTVSKRVDGIIKFFSHRIIYKDAIPLTIVSNDCNILFGEQRQMNFDELCECGSFPKDYNFMGVQPVTLIGMSVPPVFMAQIAYQIYLQWLTKINT